jgi:hypothetical protein
VRPWDAATELPEPQPPQDIEEGDGTSAPSAEGAPGVSFRVTTLPQGGRYEPKNAGAIWVEDTEGSWVKTLALWASVRVRYLTEYQVRNPSHDKTDAITSATLREHQTHEVRWNLEDAAGESVADGDYVVVVEVTDRDASGKVLEVGFTKASEPLHVTLEDSEFFADVELRYE